MRKLRIKYIDSFNNINNTLYDILRKTYDIEIVEENPDIRVGKIGILGRRRYRLWFKWSMVLRRGRQLLLYNV